MASDLISRAAAIKYLMTNMSWHDDDGYEVDDADEKRMIITDLVNRIPAVEAAPVVHGHWINHFDDLFPADSTIECSECHEHTHYMPDDNYCPNCGAKMDGGEDDE